MKPIVTHGLALSVGVLIGSLVVLAWLGSRAAKEASKLYLTKLFDEATLAVELQAGRQSVALARLQFQLAEHARQVRNFHGSSVFYTNALWMINAFYQTSGTEPPPGVAASLQGLPAEPPALCRNRLQQVFGNQLPNLK